MPLVFLMIIIFLGTSIPDIIEKEERKTAINKGLEECPNLRSNFSNDTVWVKNCEDFMRAYKNEEKKKDVQL